MKTIFNILYGIFIGLLVLIGSLFLMSLTPIEIGIEAKIVQSGSMEPSIPVGALVFIKPNETYEIGDIITFGEDSSSAIPKTHRVLSVRNENGTTMYTTKGDANEGADPQEVAKRDIIGRVLLAVPYAGFVLDFARQPLGFALLIGVPALLVIVAELVAIMQELAQLWRRRVLAPKLARRRLPLAVSASSPPHSVEYVRLFAMDDVFIPLRILAGSMHSPQEERVRHLSAHYKGALTSTLAVVCVAIVASLGNSGGTLSYFRDTETSTGNTFGAGTWEAQIEEFMTGGEALTEAVSEATEEVVGEDGVSEEITQEEDESAPRDEEEGSRREGREDRDAREERSDDVSATLEVRASAESVEISAEPDLQGDVQITSLAVPEEQSIEPVGGSSSAI